jgi:glycosyltransferase involved in cell wall biosynthesis
VVHVEGIELAPYIDLLQGAHNRPVILFDDHNCEYALQERILRTDLRNPLRWHGAAYSFVQWRRLRQYEAEACLRSDQVVVVSQPDGDALRSLVPHLKTLVIPNGIDLSAYPADMAPAPEMGDAALVFTAKMDFRPNVDAMLWFAGQVLPLIRRQVPQAHLWIVGQRPHRRLNALRRNPGVTLTGWVDQIQPYIAGASVYVAPLRMGGGTRLKLLEAMALERAVVATELGAEGFPVIDGQELLLANTAEDFAGTVVALLQNPERRTEMGRRARRFVQAGYDWSVLIPNLEAAYRVGLPRV